MIISSEKANLTVRKIVDFASRHRWAKYPGIAAVSAVYGADWLRAVTVELGEKIRESMNAPFRPLAGRVASAFLSAAFAFMVVPVGITAGAEETGNAELPPVAGESVWGQAPSTDSGSDNTGNADITDNADNADITAEVNEASKTEQGSADTAGETSTSEEAPQPRKRVTREKTKSKRKWFAKTPEEIAGRITMEGLPDHGGGYGITLNVGTLGRDVTARFTSRREMIDEVKYCFECYDIPTDNLYIAPVDVTIYGTDDRLILNFKEDRDCTADITLPLPNQFDGHTDDVKVVRLDAGNRMTVLDCNINESEDGRTVTFNTEHFSVFAMVAYRELPGAPSPELPETTENIGSGAPITANGVQASAAVNMNLSPFDEDRRRFGKKSGRRKVYRIKRICKEYEKLL